MHSTISAVFADFGFSHPAMTLLTNLLPHHDFWTSPTTLERRVPPNQAMNRRSCSDPTADLGPTVS